MLCHVRTEVGSWTLGMYQVLRIEPRRIADTHATTAGAADREADCAGRCRIGAAGEGLCFRGVCTLPVRAHGAGSARVGVCGACTLTIWDLRWGGATRAGCESLVWHGALHTQCDVGGGLNGEPVCQTLRPLRSPWTSIMSCLRVCAGMRLIKLGRCEALC